jgi:hypothetical protein
VKREEMLGRVRSHNEPWDIIVVGGGATGAGVAVAPVVASLLARELGKDQAWADTEVERFIALAAQYRLEKTVSETAA